MLVIKVSYKLHDKIEFSIYPAEFYTELEAWDNVLEHFGPEVEFMGAESITVQAVR